MKEVVLTLIYASIPVSLFAIAAFLMYTRTPYWWAFLVAVVLITGSMRWSVS